MTGRRAWCGRRASGRAPPACCRASGTTRVRARSSSALGNTISAPARCTRASAKVAKREKPTTTVAVTPQLAAAPAMAAAQRVGSP